MRIIILKWTYKIALLHYSTSKINNTQTLARCERRGLKIYPSYKNELRRILVIKGEKKERGSSTQGASMMILLCGLMYIALMRYILYSHTRKCDFSILLVVLLKTKVD